MSRETKIFVALFLLFLIVSLGFIYFRTIEVRDFEVIQSEVE